MNNGMTIGLRPQPRGACRVSLSGAWTSK